MQIENNVLLKVDDRDIINGTFIIPDNVTSIDKFAFSYCTSLATITIPDSVISIGKFAFSHCTSLATITIPNSVTSIGYCAFFNCTSLTTITIPNSITSIGDGVFYNCTSLATITIPNSVTSIGYCAFIGCTSLTTITIPNSVTSIGNDAFKNCTNLSIIIINAFDEANCNRIKALIPKALQAQVEIVDGLQALSAEIKKIQSYHLNHLMNQANINELYRVLNYNKSKIKPIELPEEIWAKINQYLQDANPIYAKAQADIAKLKKPITQNELDAYDKMCETILDNYIKLATQYMTSIRKISNNPSAFFPEPNSCKRRKTMKLQMPNLLL